MKILNMLVSISFAACALILLSACNQQPLVNEPAVSDEAAPPVSVDTAESVPEQDLSDVHQLPKEAKKLLELGQALEKETKASCRKDDTEMWRIVREAASASNSWRSLKATDLHRIQFSGCNSYLGDIQSLANICVKSIYSTTDFQRKDRYSKEDRAQCLEELKQKWPRSLEELRAEMN